MLAGLVVSRSIRGGIKKQCQLLSVLGRNRTHRLYDLKLVPRVAGGQWHSTSSLACASSDSNEDSLHSGIDFSDMSGLSPHLVQRLDKLGFKSAFDIQAETLPHTLNGKDVIGRAVTGSGKTLAFAIPVIEKLSASKRCSNPRAIAIAPTRELCKQIMESIAILSDQLRCVALYGGDPYYRQERELQRGVDVVCATPGRLNDHVRRGNLNVKDVEFLILDEADELLTPNFKIQIEDVLNDTPRTKQMMLFSATMPPNIRHLIAEHMADPVMVDLVKKRGLVPSSITHQVMMVKSYSRDRVVVELIHTRKPERVIVFTQTKLQASSLARYLVRNGIMASSLHSGLSQSVRESVLSSFRSGDTKVIAATDVAARGIDIPEIDLVIHCGVPPSGVDYYIHRSGRTGRGGLKGTSILLLHPSSEAKDFLYQLQKSMSIETLKPPTFEEVLKNSIQTAVAEIENFDPKLSAFTSDKAKEMFETHGVDALASALAIIANLKSRETERGDQERQSWNNSERRPWNNSERRPWNNSERRPWNNSEKRSWNNSEKRSWNNSEKRSWNNSEKRPSNNSERRSWNNSKRNNPGSGRHHMT